MTHTPRTDNEYQLGFNNQRYVRVDFARQLERELAQARTPVQADTDKLLPCPFCNASLSLMVVHTHRRLGRPARYRVLCGGCGCQSDTFTKREPAIAAWNTRVPAAPGMVMVPVEPTEAMLNVIMQTAVCMESEKYDAQRIYAELLKAAEPGAGRKG